MYTQESETFILRWISFIDMEEATQIDLHTVDGFPFYNSQILYTLCSQFV